MEGCRYLLAKPAPCVALKGSSATGVEYEISGFVVSMDQKRMVRNLLFDLAFRHLQASGVSLLSSVSAWWHVGGVLIIVGALWILPEKHQSVSWTLTGFHNETGWAFTPSGG